MPGLFADTRPEPECVRALGTVWRNSPSAYFGCGARTQAHFDLLENLFCVVAGAKQVMLWHPAQGAAVLYPGSDGDACKSQADIFQPDLVRFPLLAEAQAAHEAVVEGHRRHLSEAEMSALRQKEAHEQALLLAQQA